MILSSSYIPGSDANYIRFKGQEHPPKQKERTKSEPQAAVQQLEARVDGEKASFKTILITTYVRAVGALPSLKADSLNLDTVFLILPHPGWVIRNTAWSIAHGLVAFQARTQPPGSIGIYNKPRYILERYEMSWTPLGLECQKRVLVSTKPCFFSGSARRLHVYDLACT